MSFKYKKKKTWLFLGFRDAPHDEPMTGTESPINWKSEKYMYSARIWDIRNVIIVKSTKCFISGKVLLKTEYGQQYFFLWHLHVSIYEKEI